MSIALFLLRSWDMYTVPFAAGTAGLAVIATLRPPANGHTSATARRSGIAVRTKPWLLAGPSADDIAEVLPLRAILIESPLHNGVHLRTRFPSLGIDLRLNSANQNVVETFCLFTTPGGVAQWKVLF